MDLINKPIQVVTSKPARQTYLNTILFVTTSTILLGLAVVAYILFYYNYVPQIGIERTIHLQYGDGPHPYGIASLDSSLVHEQDYDLSLILHVPRSPSNIALGNFMLSLSLLSSSYKPASQSTTPPSTLLPPLSSSILPSDIIFTTRRPAILTYTSRLISLSDRIFSLPLYILGLRRESEVLHIPMAEHASFKRGRSNIPAYILLEIQSGQEVQVYDIRVHFTARFSGLRWMMYNHRILSFLIFVSAFWIAEIIWSAVGWLLFRSLSTKPALLTPKPEEQDPSVKQEDETDDPDLSDTPRTFPTYGRQAPLRYEPRVKDEDSEEYILDETTIQPLAAEADDESEDFGGRSGLGTRTDSGLGTSFDEGRGRGLARKRSSGVKRSSAD
ncbi:putative adipose-regulatory protein-domain-containing protein [Bisporella sp. PMI_857]|nr:putative adipose-regulatory protein-domain-containing protein [Bisporella sp. PMI_857]